MRDDAFAAMPLPDDAYAGDVERVLIRLMPVIYRLIRSMPAATMTFTIHF